MSDFNSLRAFQALLRHGSVTRAALALNIPKSTLSRRLSALEQDVGHCLTRQEHGRLIATDAGLRYAKYCERILALADEGRGALQQAANVLAGTLNVAVDSELTGRWAMHLINGFLERYPGVQMLVNVQQPHSHRTRSGPDCWIASGPLQIEGYRPIRLTQWERHLYASALRSDRCRQVQHPSAAIRCPWIGLGGMPGAEQEISLLHTDSRETLLLSPQARLHVATPLMLADNVARGIGVALLPDWISVCPNLGLRERLTRIMPAWQAEPISVSLHVPIDRQTPGVAQLVLFLRSVIEGEGGSGL